MRCNEKIHNKRYQTFYGLQQRKKEKKIPSLSIFVSRGIMKSSTVETIARSGLNFEHLKTIFNRKGEYGLINGFTMKTCEGLPRITSTKRVLESVIPKLVSYVESIQKQ